MVSPAVAPCEVLAVLAGSSELNGTSWPITGSELCSSAIKTWSARGPLRSPGTPRLARDARCDLLVCGQATPFFLNHSSSRFQPSSALSLR